MGKKNIPDQYRVFLPVPDNLLNCLHTQYTYMYIHVVQGPDQEKYGSNGRCLVPLENWKRRGKRC